MRCLRLLIILIVVLSLLAGCGDRARLQKPTQPKPLSEAEENKSPKSSEFTTVWLAPDANNPQLLGPCLSYKGYAYETVPVTEEDIGSGMYEYIGGYEKEGFYADKDDAELPPLRLWSTNRPEQSGFSKLYKRGPKASDLKQVPTERRTSSNSELQLTFELPKQDFNAGTRYIAKATLTNLSDRSISIDTVGLFEVVISDAYYRTLKDPFIGAAGVEFARLEKGDSISQTVVFRINEPGKYRISCRLTRGETEPKEPGLKQPEGPVVNKDHLDLSKYTTSKPPSLKTEPTSITIK